MATTPSKVWTKIFGSSSIDESLAITTGLDGSIYISGYTESSLDGQIYNGGSGDAFLSKYSPDGKKVWTKLLGSYGQEVAYAITTGLDNSIYISGYTTSSLDGQPYIGGNYDTFLTKYSPDGTKIWTKLLGGDRDDIAHALTTGLDGSIYVSGYTDGPLDGQTKIGSSTFNRDVFLTKYSPDGTKVWTKLLSSDDSDVANALTTGLDGSIYVSGYTAGSLDGQAKPGSSLYDRDVFLTKYSPDGTKVWTKLLGTNYADVANALVTGLDGSIYVSGYTKGSLDGQTNIGGKDVFLSKYNPDGTKSWTKLFGSTTDDEATALTTGLDGSIYVSGYIAGSLDGQGSVKNLDTFLIQYSADGTIIWTEQLGAKTLSQPQGLTTGIDGSIYITGTAYGSFDGQTFSGNKDTFLVKYQQLATPTYTLKTTDSSINEGSTATFTLTTTNVASGILIPYTLSGISAADVSGGSLSGNAVVNASGVATISVSLLSDSLTEGSETLTVSAGGASASLVVNDTSKSLTPTISGYVFNSTNGHTYAFLNGVNSWQVAKDFAESSTYQGQKGYLTTITSQAEDTFIFSQFVGPKNLSSSAGNSIGLGGSDADSEGTWIWVGGPEKGQLFTYNSDFKGNDGTYQNYLSYWGSNPGWDDMYVDSIINSPNGYFGFVVEFGGATPTYSLAGSSGSFNEGLTATFTLTTTNVASGISVLYTLSGISAADVSGGSLSGNAVVNSNGVATISVSLLNDYLTEGTETLTVTAGGASASGVY